MNIFVRFKNAFLLLLAQRDDDDDDDVVRGHIPASAHSRVMHKKHITALIVCANRFATLHMVMASYPAREKCSGKKYQ